MASEFKPRYTVASLTDAIRASLEGGFSRIFVDGEISGMRISAPGHVYFTLKDQSAVISAVMFAGSFSRCKARARLRDGAKVLVYGKVSVYGPRGQYQIVVSDARIEGEGDLMQRYLELKAKLEREGLFAAERKRMLPFLPRRIGLVTSETGAVVHDMCRVLARRFPDLEIRLHPAVVQGEDAPRTLIAGLDYFNRLAAEEGAWHADLVIVARGGGSFEDLFCFNDEALVRAVAASRVPVISAVGHETDYTLCDFAADVRAGTPSIAAETAVPVEAELRERLGTLSSRLASSLRARGEWFAQRTDHLSDALAASLTVAAERAARRLGNASARLGPSVSLALSRAEERLKRNREKLVLLSPYGVLERGYALVTDSKGAVVRSASQVAEGAAVAVRFADGAIDATVRGRRGA